MRTRESFMVMAKIAERADNMGLLQHDRVSLLMDLENVNDQVGLRLDDFLKADDSNFAHDIREIQNNINRTTKKLEGYFVPRFAK